MQKFLLRAVDTSIVVETRENSDNLLYLPSELDANNNSSRPSISLSVSPPIGVELPTKTINWTTRLPYILFAPKGCAPSQDLFPPNTFVRNSVCKKWFVLMFKTLTSAQRAVTRRSWLRSCVLVDWRRASESNPQLTHIVALQKTEVITSLKDKFDSMKTNQARMTVLFNAKEREKFFVAKGPYGQTVGLTHKDAAFNPISVPLKNEETQDDLEPNRNVDVKNDSSDGES